MVPKKGLMLEPASCQLILTSSSIEYSESVSFSRQLNKVLDHLRALAEKAKGMEITISTIARENVQLKDDVHALLKAGQKVASSVPESIPEPMPRSSSPTNWLVIMFLILPLTVIIVSVLFFSLVEEPQAAFYISKLLQLSA